VLRKFFGAWLLLVWQNKIQFYWSKIIEVSWTIFETKTNVQPYFLPCQGLNWIGRKQFQRVRKAVALGRAYGFIWEQKTTFFWALKSSRQWLYFSNASVDKGVMVWLRWPVLFFSSPIFSPWFSCLSLSKIAKWTIIF
jgi:hypothetical protein